MRSGVQCGRVRGVEKQNVENKVGELTLGILQCLACLRPERFDRKGTGGSGRGVPDTYDRSGT